MLPFGSAALAAIVIWLGAEGTGKPVRADRTQDSAAPPAVALAGRTDTDSGESRRNENVQFNLVDNNAMREFRQRMGTTATIVGEFTPDRSYFGAEFGAAPSAPIHLRSGKSPGAVHGQAFWGHTNSAVSARSFFQAGPVQPARENQYGFQVAIPVARRTWLSVDGSQEKQRGQVNGNVLIPLAGERTLLTSDPAKAAILNRWIAAWPNAAPNRTDIDPRALNTNAPQQIDTDSAALRLERVVAGSDRLIARYSYTNQRVDAFQFAAGQNPDTNTRNHNARLTWQRVFRPATVADFTLGFDRIASLLTAEPNAVGPQVQIGTAFTALGPGSAIPIDRVWNRYRYSAAFQHRAGRHRMIFGGEVTRFQSNGEETSANRGNWFFRNDFGRDAITNFRLGTPTRYSFAVGELNRGFRNWEQNYYFGDTIQIRGDLTVSLGVRYQPQTGPKEVQNRTIIPYSCDCNNFGPGIGIAWKTRRGILRTGYVLQYNDIFPATFMQTRWNPPGLLKPEVQVPDLLDPTAGADLSPNGRSLVFLVPSNLAAPYSHQYNFSWETTFAKEFRLQVGYVGSRTHKLFLMWFENRARVVPGIPQTTATINLRRQNPAFFEMRHVMNGSRAYFDAARVSVVTPNWKRLTVDAAYWWSKAIDTGGNYINTAAGDDARGGYAQSQGVLHADLKGVSEFDQAHSLMTRVSYDFPALRTAPRWLESSVGGWRFQGIWLAKTGMPFTVISGSDAPGFGNVDGTNGDRPNLLDPSILGRKAGHPDSTPEWLNRSAFAFIRTTDDRGNLGMNTFRRAGILNVNAGLSRTWVIASERSLTLRGDSINLTNSPQFAAPNFDLTSPAFGKITNTLNEGRTFRFTLQARF